MSQRAWKVCRVGICSSPTSVRPRMGSACQRPKAHRIYVASTSKAHQDPDEDEEAEVASSTSCDVKTGADATDPAIEAVASSTAVEVAVSAVPSCSSPAVVVEPTDADEVVAAVPSCSSSLAVAEPVDAPGPSAGDAHDIAAAVDLVVEDMEFSDDSGEGSAVESDTVATPEVRMTHQASRSQADFHVSPGQTPSASPARCNLRQTAGYQSRAAERDQWFASLGIRTDHLAAKIAEDRNTPVGTPIGTPMGEAYLRDPADGFRDEARRLTRRMQSQGSPAGGSRLPR
mmetsp:Transcript_14223/g.39176  ORF Transcript_14223/g.39176 Transcript_14223/m.39176 type:complete len:287 (+) Transcript_14223:40-900(+)